MKDKKNINEYGTFMTNNDKYVEEEKIAYLIDYLVNSTTAQGSKSKGSVYIRGVKGKEGWDSFKFILEKTSDFSEFDAKLIVNAYENAFVQN